MIPTTMRLVVFRHDRVVKRTEIALTRDKFTRVKLGEEFSKWVKPLPNHKEYKITSGTLATFIDAYSEQAVSDPLADLKKFVDSSGLGGMTPGQVATGSSVFDYASKGVKRNTAATAAIGEGLAGWYLERVEHINWHCRPIGVAPDAIFHDPKLNRYALSEAKTVGTRQKVTTQLKKASFDLLDILAKTKLIRKGKYIAYAFVIAIRGIGDYEIHVLRMEES